MLTKEYLLVGFHSFCDVDNTTLLNYLDWIFSDGNRCIMIILCNFVLKISLNDPSLSN